MINALLVGGLGAIGAVCRYSVQSCCQKWFHNERVPLVLLGTLSVNVVGCFLLGFLWSLPEWRAMPHFRVGLQSGFLGALTTFSTFGVETFAEIEKGHWGFAMSNIGLNLALGLLAAWLGVVIGRGYFPQ